MRHPFPIIYLVCSSQALDIVDQAIFIKKSLMLQQSLDMPRSTSFWLESDDQTHHSQLRSRLATYTTSIYCMYRYITIPHCGIEYFLKCISNKSPIIVNIPQLFWNIFT